MAITYPRPFLERAGPGTKFRVTPGVVVAPENSGDAPAGLVAWPRWVLDFQSAPLTGIWTGIAEAWIASLQNGIGTFLAPHPDRPFPRAYPSGFDGLNIAGGVVPFDGVAGSWSLDASRGLLSASGLPANFELREFDMLDWSWAGGSKRYLAGLLEGVAANDDGEITDAAFSPFAPAWLPGDAVLSFARPSCIMRIVPDSVQMTLDRGGRGSLSFSALQVLLP